MRLANITTAANDAAERSGTAARHVVVHAEEAEEAVDATLYRDDERAIRNNTTAARRRGLSTASGQMSDGEACASTADAEGAAAAISGAGGTARVVACMRVDLLWRVPISVRRSVHLVVPPPLPLSPPPSVAVVCRWLVVMPSCMKARAGQQQVALHDVTVL